MKYYKLKFENGTSEIVTAKDIKSLIHDRDLATKEHTQTRIFELEGEQLAIAISNEQE